MCTFYYFWKNATLTSGIFIFCGSAHNQYSKSTLLGCTFCNSHLAPEPLLLCSKYLILFSFILTKWHIYTPTLRADSVVTCKQSNRSNLTILAPWLLLALASAVGPHILSWETSIFFCHFKGFIKNSTDSERVFSALSECAIVLSLASVKGAQSYLFKCQYFCFCVVLGCMYLYL